MGDGKQKLPDAPRDCARLDKYPIGDAIQTIRDAALNSQDKNGRGWFWRYAPVPIIPVV